MLGELKELWKYRALLSTMVSRDLKIRYKNSFLGFLWSMINPLTTVVVLTFVFKGINALQTPNYSAYLLAGYLPYMFFQSALMDSAQSVVGNLNLIKKIYFPREILPLASIISNFIHLILAIGVFFVYLLSIAVWHHDSSVFQWSILLLPVALIINFFLVTGLGLLFSALNVFYEDVKYIISIGLYMLFFLCPIMWFSEITYYPPSGSFRKFFLVHLDPVATMAMFYRKILLPPEKVQLPNTNLPITDPKAYGAGLPINWTLVGITAAFSVFILFYGYHVFNKMKWKFVERP